MHFKRVRCAFKPANLDPLLRPCGQYDSCCLRGCQSSDLMQVILSSNDDDPERRRDAQLLTSSGGGGGGGGGGGDSGDYIGGASLVHLVNLAREAAPTNPAVAFELSAALCAHRSRSCRAGALGAMLAAVEACRLRAPQTPLVALELCCASRLRSQSLSARWT